MGIKSLQSTRRLIKILDRKVRERAAIRPHPDFPIIMTLLDKENVDTAEIYARYEEAGRPPPLILLGKKESACGTGNS